MVFGFCCCSQLLHPEKRNPHRWLCRQSESAMNGVRICSRSCPLGEEEGNFVFHRISSLPWAWQAHVCRVMTYAGVGNRSLAPTMA